MVVALPAVRENLSGKPALKLLCSYGGRILPRHSDGRLRYVGGETRLVSLPRSAPVSELLGKFPELSGWPVTLRCQLPTGDLDELVSITTDEDLSNVVEEYDRKAGSSGKIRAFLFSGKPKTPSPTGSFSSSSPASASSPTGSISPAPTAYLRRSSTGLRKCCVRCGHRAGAYLIHPGNFGNVGNVGNGNHWQ